MAQDIFLNLSGIAGEALDAAHAQQIDVLNWEWAVSQPSSTHVGQGGGAGKAQVDDLVFEHYVDRASPNLMIYSLTGKHIPTATLTVRKAGGAPLEYLTIKMHDVIVTRVAPHAQPSMTAAREEVALSFARVEQEYVVQSPNGGSAGTVRMAFDIKKNCEF
ncbi:Hcp1 family type VI secretion system effector [Caballeronia pedi]|uniref:Hcp1 family type VI secretion system effector n=1 Tax=Caballeronia pedi TaxID=1777141 RepID=A0A158ALE0_9BURK|nr:type VI secretion system tube protein Hcp [Caballeronia pedi]SAK58602.1 Hcp1 family type VI secretion system effector [Caballeronia pedi]